jgi:uncharacterized membrane protein YqjE
MAAQAAMNSNTRASTNGTSGNFAPRFGTVADFVHDLAALADLQVRLAAVDLEEASRRAALPLALTIAGAAIMFAGLPVALFGAAWLIASVTGVQLGYAMLLSAAVAAVCGGLTLYLSVRSLRKSCASFERSRAELIRNVSWLRTVVASGNHASSRRQS